ncbi:MAG: NAD(P)-dependent oxidoreductase [Mycobacterium sp.]|nr:NAD(P)-dependent oxidoreductase [Mycobacterium sp.]
MTGAQGRPTPAINGVRVLVTGGSGFIGRSVCRHLADAGADVLNFDVKPWPGPDIGPRTVIGDIEDANAMSDACRTHDPTIFIHLAAFASVTATSRDDFSSIWNGTRVAAEAFADASRPRRLVNISTQLVIRPGIQPEHLRDYDPYTPYGAAKAEAEIFLHEHPRPYEVAHVRPTNIWGQHHPSYATSVMRYIQKGWYLHPVAGKPVMRTYGYVDNCAKQIISVAFSERLSDNDILYGGDQTMDSADFLDALSMELRGAPVRRLPVGLLRRAGAAGSFLQRLGLPAPLDRERVMRMSTDYVVPLDPTQEVMAFPVTPFDLGMRRTADWYRAGATPDWNPSS